MAITFAEAFPEVPEDERAATKARLRRYLELIV